MIGRLPNLTVLSYLTYDKLEVLYMGTHALYTHFYKTLKEKSHISLLIEIVRIMEVLWPQQASSEEERDPGREAALILIEGDSDDIDILPSWLHFGLT